MRSLISVGLLPCRVMMKSLSPRISRVLLLLALGMDLPQAQLGACCIATLAPAQRQFASAELTIHPLHSQDGNGYETVLHPLEGRCCGAPACQCCCGLSFTSNVSCNGGPLLSLPCAADVHGMHSDPTSLSTVAHKYNTRFTSHTQTRSCLCRGKQWPIQVLKKEGASVCQIKKNKKWGNITT